MVSNGLKPSVYVLFIFYYLFLPHEKVYWLDFQNKVTFTRRSEALKRLCSGFAHDGLKSVLRLLTEGQPEQTRHWTGLLATPHCIRLLTGLDSSLVITRLMRSRQDFRSHTSF